MCFLSLSSRNEPVFDSHSIFKYVSKKTATHVLNLISINLVDESYSSDKSLFPKVDTEGIALFKSLINHSCCPNVFFVCIENKIVGFVIKPIKAGEQLFRCYL